MEKLKQQLKEIFLTKEGWAGWIVANIITSLPWAIPLALGFLLQNKNLYIAAGAVWAFIVNPVTPFWILNLFIAVGVKNMLLKKGRSTPEQRMDQKGRTNYE